FRISRAWMGSPTDGRRSPPRARRLDLQPSGGDTVRPAERRISHVSSLPAGDLAGSRRRGADEPGVGPRALASLRTQPDPVRGLAVFQSLHLLSHRSPAPDLLAPQAV